MATKTTHTRKRIIIGASILAITLGLTSAALVGITANADVGPRYRASSDLVAGTYYYNLSMNPEGARVLFYGYGDSGGLTGIAATAIGVLSKTSSVGYAVASVLGTSSAAQYLTGGAIRTCSNDFTEAVTVTIVHGGFIGCEVNERYGIGGDF